MQKLCDMLCPLSPQDIKRWPVPAVESVQNSHPYFSFFLFFYPFLAILESVTFYHDHGWQ